MQFDVLAIGDTTVDAFIRLKDARVTCDINDANCMICLRFGDKVPYESVEVVPGVGNSANAAVACGRLGLHTALRVYVGNDDDGKKCIEQFERNGVDTSLVVVDPVNKTNYHYVLWYESERTILIKHEKYPYSFPVLQAAPKWIYLSSLGEGTEPYQQEIAQYIRSHGDVKLAFQPGTFQIKLGAEALKDIYSRSEIFFCNKEEAQTILNMKETNERKLLDGIRALGVNIAVVTDGRKGAYAMDDSGAWHVPMYPDPAPPVSRTGAGDASASTTVAYLALGYSLEDALMRGLINSMSVVQGVGAQKGLLTREQIEEWYAKRPPEFKATAI